MKLPSVEGLLSRTKVRFWPKDSSSLIGSIHIHLGLANLEVPGSSIEGAPQWWKADHAVRHVDTLLRDHIPGLEELTIQVEQDLHIT
jgi:zinc transporter 5/7